MSVARFIWTEDDISPLSGKPKDLATAGLHVAEVALLSLRLSDGWTRGERGITKTFSFPNRRASAAFTTTLMASANTVNHHPDVVVDGDNVHVTFITHATESLTAIDFACAETADRLAATTPSLPRNAGDHPGHEFHGNQWTTTLGAIHDRVEATNKEMDAYRQVTFVHDNPDIHEHIDVSRLKSNATIDDIKKLAPSKIKIDTVDEATRRVEDHTKALIAGSHIAVRVPMSALPKIVEDGKLKTQFETNASRGDLDIAARAQVEKDLFDVPPTQVSDRTVYGFAFHDIGHPRYESGHPQGGFFGSKNVGQYGEVSLLLKDGVKDRATLSSGDTLAEYDTAFRAHRATIHDDEKADDQHFAPVKMDGSDRSRLGFDLLENRNLLHARNIDDVNGQHGAIETHIHGGVKLDDVEKAVIHYDAKTFHEIDPDAVLALMKRGIPVELRVPKGGYFHDDYRTYMHTTLPGVKVIGGEKITPPGPIRKATIKPARDAGDHPGHDFRGNQWTPNTGARDAITRLAAKYPDVAARYQQDSGTEIGSVLAHTQDVARVWEKQISSQELADISDRWGSDVSKLMHDAIALHDIGKGEAVEAGDKDQQHEFTVPVLRDVLTREGYGPRDVQLATELLNHDMLGKLMQDRGHHSQQEIAALITTKAEALGMSPHDFATLQLAVYHADAGAYPYVVKNFMTADASGKLSMKKLTKMRDILALHLHALGDKPGHDFHGNQWEDENQDEPDEPMSPEDARIGREIADFVNKWEGSAAAGSIADMLGGNTHVVMYHGTTSEALASIKEKGLVPHGGRGADEYARQDYNIANFAVGDRTSSVFMSSKLDVARRYADWTTSIHPNSQPVVLRIALPGDVLPYGLRADEKALTEQQAFRYRGTVKPEWIKRVGAHGELSALTAPPSRRVYYAVMVVNDEPRTLGDKPGHDFHGNQWGVGVHSDGTITLLHGTTKLNADAILKEGFRSGAPATVAAAVEKEYSLPKDSVLNNVSFTFASKRGDLDRVHLTSKPDIAVQYTVPEVLQDALSSAWSLQHPDIETWTRELKNEKDAWVKREGARLTQPDVLAVRLPWSAVGDHAFGRKISLDEFQNHPHLKGNLDILHSISVPISVMKDAVITRAVRPRSAGDKAGHEFHGNQWHSELGKELSAKTWLHGTGHALDGPLRDPVFLTTDPDGAAWYAQNRGADHDTIVPVTVDVKRPFAIGSYADAVKLSAILKNADISADVTDGPNGWTWSMAPGASSPYDGDNPLDVVYHPEARRALIDAGFDAVYSHSDPLSNGEIDALVLLDAATQLKGKLSKRALGEGDGHAFHGNQWTEGEGGDPRPLSEDETKAITKWGKDNRQSAKLTRAERAAVIEYRRATAFELNDALRNDTLAANPALKSIADRLDAAIDKAVVNKDVVVYRGVPLDLRARVGGTLRDKGFLATTFNAEQAALNFSMGPGNKSTIMELHVPKGSHGLYTEGLAPRGYEMNDGQEHELLLPRNTPVTITGVSRSRGTTYVSGRVMKLRAAGDAPGHEFHGNQWTGDHRHADSSGRGTLDSPARVWRGVRGNVKDARTPRVDVHGEGYNFTTYASNKHMADTYVEHGKGEAQPFTIAAKRVIEFPVRKSRYGSGNDFDKFEFDRRARNLGNDEALVARQVIDTGPWSSNQRDPQHFFSYPGDIYAVKNPALVTHGHAQPRSAGEAVGHEFHGNQWTGSEDQPPVLSRHISDFGGGEVPTPYGWSHPTGDAYTVPVITHKVIRENGTWGYSHSNSQGMTGVAAKMMGIKGYRSIEGDDAAYGRTVKRFLTAIADDKTGSEEVLHHSFENVRHTDFKVGDTLRLPLTATSGDVGSYGQRTFAEDQAGPPTVFEFEKGTQMAAYSPTWTQRDVRNGDIKSLDEGFKEMGHVWGEAIVAGGFEVTYVDNNVYMGTQRYGKKDGGSTWTGDKESIGTVVRLRQRETFVPEQGWKRRG